jgi:hypothetical protein
MSKPHVVVIFGVMVSMLSIGPKVSWFNPDQERWIFKGENICNMPFFGGEVKPSAPSCKILLHVKNPLKYEQRYEGYPRSNAQSDVVSKHFIFKFHLH